MSDLIRCITSDGSIAATAIDSTEITRKAQRLHRLSPVTTAALGRLLAGASLMGVALKHDKASLTLRIAGDGPAGAVIAVSDSTGSCRGYVADPTVDLPLTASGKLDVSGAVGKNGLISVMKDHGYGEPFIGTTRLVSGEIAEDITGYFAESEQLPTVCSLGVLLEKDTHRVICSGGFLIQLLPGFEEGSIDILEKNIAELPPFTTMLSQGLALEGIVGKALEGFDIELLEKKEVGYVCHCSRERVERALATLPEAELKQMKEETEFIEVGCHFCDKKYKIATAGL